MTANVSTLSLAEVRQQCAEFAATYPSANVRRAIACAESGAITWAQCYALFHKALSAGLAEVAR